MTDFTPMTDADWIELSDGLCADLSDWKAIAEGLAKAGRGLVQWPLATEHDAAAMEVALAAYEKKKEEGK